VNGVFSIGSAARLLRVPVATIRTWEKRYGGVVPARSTGGQRLYTREQLEQLRFVVDRVSEGMRPADAHRLLRTHDGVSQRLDVEIESGARAPAQARDEVEGFAAALGEVDGFNLRLLVSELVANSVRYGGGAHIRLLVRMDSDRVHVEVSDDGEGFDWRTTPNGNGNGNGDADGGRGLPLVAALADRWGLTFDGGTTAWFELRRSHADVTNGDWFEHDS
jgi:DNA-binding transcriptional MerR regulator